MADLNQQTTVTLTVNGRQAEQTIKSLEERARQLHQQMMQALRTGILYILRKGRTYRIQGAVVK